MISNESKWILEHIKSDIGIGTWFNYADIKRAFDYAGVEFSVLQFKKWMTGAAQLASLQGLCLVHPTEASNYRAVLVAGDAEGAEKATDAYLHVARTNTGVSRRLEMYVDLMDAGAEPGSDGAIAAEAAKGMFQMQEILQETFDNMNKQLAEKRRIARRAQRETQAIEGEQ